MNWFKESQMMTEDLDYFEEFQDYGDYVPDIDKINDIISKRLGITLKDKIGHGDNGTAYLTSNGKVIKITTSSKEGKIAQWLLNNPNEYIIDIYDVWTVGDLYIIYMDHIDKMASSISAIQQIFNYIQKLLNSSGCTNIKCALSVLKHDGFISNLPIEMKDQIFGYISHLMNLPTNLYPFDFLNINNIGIKNGKLQFFDIN